MLARRRDPDAAVAAEVLFVDEDEDDFVFDVDAPAAEEGADERSDGFELFEDEVEGGARLGFRREDGVGIARGGAGGAATGGHWRKVAEKHFRAPAARWTPLKNYFEPPPVPGTP